MSVMMMTIFPWSNLLVSYLPFLLTKKEITFIIDKMPKNEIAIATLFSNLQIQMTCFMVGELSTWHVWFAWMNILLLNFVSQRPVTSLDINLVDRLGLSLICLGYINWRSWQEFIQKSFYIIRRFKSISRFRNIYKL